MTRTDDKAAPADTADADVVFRRLTDDDLPVLYRWLNDPGVVRWWEGNDVSWEGVVRDYGSSMPYAVEHWIASVDGRDVGWIQCYAAAADDSEECAVWFAHGVDRGAAGIDYLIGDPAARGRGLGSRMIRAFVRDVVFARHPSWTQACASPYVSNLASWRALARAGFSEWAVIDSPDDPDGPMKLMVIDRAQVEAAPGASAG